MSKDIWRPIAASVVIASGIGLETSSAAKAQTTSVPSFLSAKIPSPIGESLTAVADNELIVATQNNIYKIDDQDGLILEAKTPTSGPLEALAVNDNNTLYIAAGQLNKQTASDLYVAKNNQPLTKMDMPTHIGNIKDIAFFPTANDALVMTETNSDTLFMNIANLDTGIVTPVAAEQHNVTTLGIVQDPKQKDSLDVYNERLNPQKQQFEITKTVINKKDNPDQLNTSTALFSIGGKPAIAGTVVTDKQGKATSVVTALEDLSVIPQKLTKYTMQGKVTSQITTSALVSKNKDQHSVITFIGGAQGKMLVTGSMIPNGQVAESIIGEVPTRTGLNASTTKITIVPSMPDTFSPPTNPMLSDQGIIAETSAYGPIIVRDNKTYFIKGLH